MNHLRTKPLPLNNAIDSPPLWFATALIHCIWAMCPITKLLWSNPLMLLPHALDSTSNFSATALFACHCSTTLNALIAKPFSNANTTNAFCCMPSFCQARLLSQLHTSPPLGLQTQQTNTAFSKANIKNAFAMCPQLPPTLPPLAVPPPLQSSWICLAPIEQCNWFSATFICCLYFEPLVCMALIEQHKWFSDNLILPHLWFADFTSIHHLWTTQLICPCFEFATCTLIHNLCTTQSLLLTCLATQSYTQCQ